MAPEDVDDPRAADDDRFDAGFTRRRLLERAAVAGLVVGSPALLGEMELRCERRDLEAKRGGRLRVGMVGGGQSETLDPNLAVSTIDTCRVLTLYDLLVQAKPDLSLEMRLATAFEPNKTATVWNIKLRKGVTRHNGKPFTADDVMYTLRRIAASKTNGALPAVVPFNLKRMRKVNANELSLPLHYPIADLAPTFVFYPLVIVQNGWTNFKKPVGTGAFMADKFKPGAGSLFKRNPNYWVSGLPYVDEVEISSIPDPKARLNALLTGQVDCVEQLAYAQAKEQQSKGKIRVLVGNSPQIVPITMSADLKPFNDVRVRQALRLIADRAGPAARRAARLRPDRERPLRQGPQVVRRRPAAAAAGPRQGEVPAQEGGPGERPGDALLEHRDRGHARVGHDLRPAGEEGGGEDRRQQRPAGHLLRAEVPQMGVRADELAPAADPELHQRVVDAEGVLQRDPLEAPELRLSCSQGAGREEVRDLLERVCLPAGLAQRFPARALAARPDVVICDEITSALDVSVQAAVLELLAELRSELGLALLFITHDLGVVASVADRVLVLDGGLVCEEGLVGALLSRPEHEYTRRLVAAAPSFVEVAGARAG